MFVYANGQLNGMAKRVTKSEKDELANDSTNYDQWEGVWSARTEWSNLKDARAKISDKNLRPASPFFTHEIETTP